MSKSMLSVFLSLLFVFLSGSLLGSLGYRWYSLNGASLEKTGSASKGGPRDPVEVRKHIIEEMKSAVNLTSEQVDQVGKILDNTRAEYEDLHHKMNAKGKEIWQKQVDEINQILREDQRPLYQQLRDKHEREREARKNRSHGIQQDTARK